MSLQGADQGIPSFVTNDKPPAPSNCERQIMPRKHSLFEGGSTRAASAFLFLCALRPCAQAVIQPEDPSLQFEVATVKPFVLGKGQPVYIGGRTSPNRIGYTAATLKYLIATAYGVNEYRVIGPKWLDIERFEVTVELPEGKTRADANLLLQNLLAERFGLTMHSEIKEMEIYELRIAKGGPKLRESGPALPPPDPDRPPASVAFNR
jgi:hypothetical protein